MAFATVARRLQRTQLHLLSSFVLLYHHSPSPFLISLSSRYYFSQSFRQTPSIPSQNYLQILRVSTLQHHLSQTLIDPFEFNPERFQIHDDLQDPGFLRFREVLEQVSQLPTEAEAMASLGESGIEPSQDMVRSAIWTLRNECRLALLAFKWGEKWGCSDEEAWNLMIWVLGNHRKFNTAWCLIRDLHRSSMDTRRAMLIMVDR